MEPNQTEIVTEPVSEMTCSACHHSFDVAGLPAFVEIVCPTCHAFQTVPARIGQFLLVELLGQGGMGAVYRGRDLSLDRWVAIKVMLSSLGDNPEFVNTFRREAQAAAALNHPSIVQVYSFGVTHGQSYMVMELLEGGRLDQMIGRGEMLNEALIFKMAVDVAEGLNAAATIGLIHGDVKPENILFDNNGIAKVVDFGLARFKQQAQSGVQGIWGTPYYIAPEKIRGHPGDARSDIYSLGATLFHALTLKPPFDGETPVDVAKARLKDPAPALRTVRPDASPEVEAVVGRMLEAEPVRRYPTYLSLLSDMRSITAHLKPAETTSSSAPLLSKRGGKIVLTKKKSASGAPVAGPLTVVSGVTGMAHATAVTEESKEKPSMSRAKKAVLITVISLVALLLIGGGATVWIQHYQREKERLASEQKEADRMEAARQEANQISSDFHALLQKSAKRVEAAKPWTADASISLSAMVAATNKLVDAAMINEVATQATATAGMVGQIAAGSLIQALADLNGMTNGLNAGRDAVFAATNSAGAESNLTALTNFPVLAQAKNAALEAEAGRGEQLLKELAAMKKKVIEQAQVQAAERERLEQEKAAEEKKRREEARKQALAAEMERLAVAEIALIDTTRKSNATLVLQNQFKQAFEAMSAIEKGFKSDAGKSALKTAIERYQMMSDMKKFIIKGIEKDRQLHPDIGLRFGWLVNGVPTRDVLGADEDKVLVRGGPVTWAEVSPAQMMRFIKKYSGDPELTKREAAQQLLAAAAYVLEAGGGSENAKKLATELVNEAVNADSKLEGKAKTSLPELY